VEHPRRERYAQCGRPDVDSVTELRAPSQPMTMQPQRASSGIVPDVSFRDLFERELDFVWNCLRRLGIPERDLEDEALEVFLRVKDTLEAFDPARSVRPWLAGFAYRVACEYRRRPRHRFERIDADVDGAAIASSPEQHAVDSEQRAIVMRALDRVAWDRRAVLVLHDVYGYTIPEVAESCDIPLNTAYSRLRLARAELAQALTRLGWSSES
jgi:RNA polymerase sigma-70 factor, ECF subfamily